MKYVIDDKVCKKYGFTLGEILTYLLLRTQTTFEDNLKSLKDKCVIYEREEIDKITYLTTEEKAALIKGILMDSVRTNPEKDEERRMQLAEKMMEIFPAGKQCYSDGKSYYWRCNKREVSDALRRFFTKYGYNTYTDEQILEATRKYVKPQPLRILKYFIIKNIREVDDEGKGYIREISDLATLLDNPGEDTFMDDSWQNKII